jgi:hypothetical protein
VNGSVLDRSQAVVDGDHLQTSQAGATVALAGATLQMGSNSELVFHPAGARVLSGSLAITTSRGLGAAVVNVRVEPVSSGARYLVSEADGKLTIAAMEGAVRVTDGKQTVVVDQDKALIAALEPLSELGQDNAGAQNQQQNAQQQDNDKNRKKKGAAGAIPAAGIGITLSKAQLIAIAAIVAAGGAVAVILLTNRHPHSGTH